MKILLAVGATLLIIVAYAPYIKNILRGQTIPHPYSWFVSGLLTLVAFGLQLSEGAVWGILPTFVAGVAGLLIFALSLHRSRAYITRLDSSFFALALIATGLWLIADQPLASAILITIADVLSFFPTIRKSWKHPNQETAFTYFVNSFRFTAATFAVQNYNLVTVLYPAANALTDVIIGLILVTRRRSVKALVLISTP